MRRMYCWGGQVKISPSSRRRKSDTRRDSAASLLHHYALTHFHPVSSHTTISSLHHFPTRTFHTICIAHSRSITFITHIDTMGSKRKRSVDDSPLSSYGAFSTPEAQSPIPFPQTFHGSMDMDLDTCSRPSGWDFASASRVKNTDWGHRTRKRVRDNRPDERSIHRMFLHSLTKPVLVTKNSQKTLYKNSSPHSATTPTPPPSHPTQHPPNNQPSPSPSPKSPPYTLSGNNSPHPPSSPFLRSSPSNHNPTRTSRAATTATRPCTAHTTPWM
jgi:hypothetical protein